MAKRNVPPAGHSGPTTEKATRLREIAAKVRQVAGAFNGEELHVDWKGWIALGPLFKEAYEAGAWQKEGSQIGDRLKRVLAAPGRDRQKSLADGLLTPAWKPDAYFAVVGPLADPLTPLDGEKENLEFEAGMAAYAIEEEAKRIEAGGGDGSTWQDVQAELDKRRLKGEPFTSQQKMADRIGCKKFLVHKAIKNGSAELKEWASKQRGASRLNASPEEAAVVFENAPQGREPNPMNITEDTDVDVMLAHLMNQAGPGERARINSMSPAEKRQLAETAYRDRNLEEQALRYRLANRSRGD